MIGVGCAQAALESFLFPEAASLAAELDRNTAPGFVRLNAAVAQLVDEWSMVAFAALDYSDEESIGDVLAQIDHCIQVRPSPATLLEVCLGQDAEATVFVHRPISYGEGLS